MRRAPSAGRRAASVRLVAPPWYCLSAVEASAGLLSAGTGVQPSQPVSRSRIAEPCLLHQRPQCDVASSAGSLRSPSCHRSPWRPCSPAFLWTAASCRSARARRGSRDRSLRRHRPRRGVPACQVNLAHSQVTMVGRGGGVGLDVGQMGLSGLSLTGAEQRPREQEVVVSDLASRERFRVGGTKPGNRSRAGHALPGDLGRLIERQTIRECGCPRSAVGASGSGAGRAARATAERAARTINGRLQKTNG